MQPQIALRHDARPTVNLVDLRVGAGYDSHPGADRCAIALRSDELELNPVLRVTAVVAEKGRQVVEIQDYGVDVAVVIEIAESCPATGKALSDAGTHLR